MSLKVKSVPTKRGVDVWDSAAFSSIFLASSFFCSQAEPTPAHLPATQIVSPQLQKGIIFRERFYTMTKLTETLSTPIPLEKVMMICKEAVASANWRVSEQGINHMKCKESALTPQSSTWPAEIAIDLTLDKKGTVIVINGGIIGWGPIQSGHLEGLMGNLRNRIEIGLQKLVEVKQQDTTLQGSSFIAELERLANLREKGALTDDEFQQAKKKLLNA